MLVTIQHDKTAIDTPAIRNLVGRSNPYGASNVIRLGTSLENVNAMAHRK